MRAARTVHLFAGLRALLLPPVTRGIPFDAVRVAEAGPGQLVREQAARAEAEAAQRRLAFLAEASQVLASSLDYEETLARVARLAVPTLADYCTVNLREADGSLRRVGKAHADPRKETVADEMHRRYPRGRRRSEGPVARVARSGVSELIPEVTDELLRGISQDAEHLQRWRALAPRSVLIVPLAARDEILGTLSLIITESERRYTQADLPLAEDLARRAALAIDNARLHAEAQRATRLRDEFLSVAAHELKTPMTSLRGYAQLLCRLLDGGRMPDPGLLVRALRTIDLESEKLVQLTGQLLDVSRVEAGKLRLERRHIDLTSVVSAAAAAAQAGTDRHTLRLQLLDECLAFVDPIRFEQVAANLLSNAIKYTPNGGEIDVVLCRDAAAQSVRLEVRDRGIGIPPERRAGLFERFYQAHGDGNFGGLGLGLYISQQIVQLHGGRIEADFPADGGTRIAVTVPLSA